MPAWDRTVVIADSKSLTAGTPETADTEDIRSPTICVSLEDLEANADDTVTTEVVTATGTYKIDERTLSSVDSFVVTSVQAGTTQITSSNGVTYSAEVRGNP